MLRQKPCVVELLGLEVLRVEEQKPWIKPQEDGKYSASCVHAFVMKMPTVTLDRVICR